jgi:hypothetical protein
LVALVVAATKATGLKADAILEDFGEFIAPDLISMFRASIKPEWRTLELLEHTEETIHKAVRLRNPGATPPELVAPAQGPGRGRHRIRIAAQALRGGEGHRARHRQALRRPGPDLGGGVHAQGRAGLSYQREDGGENADEQADVLRKASAFSAR